MAIVKVPQLAWHGPKNLELAIPDDWQIEICNMAGYDRPALSPRQIGDGIRNPLAGMPIRELARGKKEVVIVFDDMARVTRTAKIVPWVLEELAEAGIPDGNIRFICGLGAHGALNRSDFIKKLGEDVVSRFQVFNHNPFGCCVYAGTSQTFRTELYVNTEYMKCDFKVVIGACVPHPSAGFGGGGKLIMPGIASFESIQSTHRRKGGVFALNAPRTGGKPTMGMGLIDENMFRRDIDECAELAGIDFFINVVVNLLGETVRVFAGADFRQVNSEAVAAARTHYKTPKTTGKDVVISNAYAKANESNVSLVMAFPLVSDDGGDIVVTANAPEGQVPHYLAGLWGAREGAVLYNKMKIPDKVNRVLYYNEYPHPGSNLLEEDPKITHYSQWGEVLRELQKSHGAGTKVAVIPDSTNQYFAWYE